MREIARIFGQFGFVVYESPEVEDDVTNFQMLNIPPDHPARDLWDTLYVDIDGLPAADAHLARPDPGHARREAADPRAAARPLLPLRGDRRQPRTEFFQVEGLMVDEGTTMGDLRGPARRVRARDVRRRQADPLPARLLPVHRAVGRVRRRVPRVRRRRAARPAAQTGWMTILGAGHGPPGRAPQRRPRPGALPGLRVRHGRRSGSRCCATAIGDLRYSSRTTCASWSSSGEGAALLAARLRRRRPDARAARRAADAARAWRSRASSAGAPTGRTSSSASCSRSRSTRDADRLSLTRVRVGDGEPLVDRLRRDEHRARPARAGRPARAPCCPAAGGSSGPRRWASSATACSARATSSA